MTKINKKALDATQLKYLAAAEKLQSELIAQGFMATRIEKDEDMRCTFKVIFFDGTHEYDISRDYRGIVRLVRVKYPHYENVSSSTRGEIWGKYRGDNVKVITAKKIQRLIDSENAYHAEVQTLNEAAENKQAAFVEEVKALESQGVEVNWSGRDGKIDGGYIYRGGLEFSFEFSQNGYISKKIIVSYKQETALDVFMQLSENKYTPVV